MNMVHDLHVMVLSRTYKNLVINHLLLINCKFKTYYLKLKYNVSKLKYEAWNVRLFATVRREIWAAPHVTTDHVVWRGNRVLSATLQILQWAAVEGV